MAGYRQIAEELVEMTRKQILRSGDRVPSLRDATRRFHASPGTVLRAYRSLEAQGVLESRPRTGYLAAHPKSTGARWQAWQSATRCQSSKMTSMPSCILTGTGFDADFAGMTEVNQRT
jgi:DNA-binding transcriptional regulator YhcF (GntR family)